MGLFFNGKCTSKARLEGKTAVITGSNSGIGKWTALDFARRGARVIMACRNTEKGEEAAQWIRDKLKGLESAGELVVKQLDLAAFDSVRKFAQEVIKEEESIHILVNNAGIMQSPFSLTTDGFESQFAVNHLGHFLLTLLLMPLILRSAPARIVIVSSLLHCCCCKIEFDKINSEKEYKPFEAYARSKAANILFTRQLAKELEGRNVTVYAVHPGLVKTKICRYYDKTVFNGYKWIWENLLQIFMKSPEVGAQTSIYCAVDEKAGMETGLYYDDCAPKRSSQLSRDPDLAKRLWDRSAEYVKLENWKQLFAPSN